MLFLTMKALFDVEPYLPHGHKWVIHSTAMKSQTQRLFIWWVLSWMLQLSLLTYGFPPVGKMLAHLISQLNMWRWSRRCLKWPAHFTPSLPVLFIPLPCLSVLFLSGPSTPSISPNFISHHFIPASTLLPLSSLFPHTFPFVSANSYLPSCAYLHLFCLMMAAVKHILGQLLTAPSAAELHTNFHPKLKSILPLFFQGMSRRRFLCLSHSMFLCIYPLVPVWLFTSWELEYLRINHEFHPWFSFGQNKRSS